MSSETQSVPHIRLPCWKIYLHEVYQDCTTRTSPAAPSITVLDTRE